MTTPALAAHALRQRLADAFAIDDPPPGLARAITITSALLREPGDLDVHHRARDLLEVVTLRCRLLVVRDRAHDANQPGLGLVAHGLIGHATAELLGAMGEPGWRAAALDLIEPDLTVVEPLSAEVAQRLLSLALGVDELATDA